MDDSLQARLKLIEEELKCLREDVHALMAVAASIARGLREALEECEDQYSLEDDDDTDPPLDEWGSMTQIQSM